MKTFRLTCFYISAILFFLTLIGYIRTKIEINTYNKPFMVLDANLSRVGIYKGDFYKKINPQFAIALCLVPNGNAEKIDWDSLNGSKGTISLTDEKGKIVWTNTMYFNGTYYFPAGNFVYCSYIPRDAFPVGRYKFCLNIINETNSLSLIKYQIIAFPVAEFLPLLAQIFLTLTFIFIIFTIVTFIFTRGDWGPSTLNREEH